MNLRVDGYTEGPAEPITVVPSFAGISGSTPE